MKPALPVLAAALFLTAGATAAEPTSLQVTSAWSRPAVAGSNGVGYFTIVNRGARPDALVGVASPVAQKAEMHSMSMAGGVMRMGPVASVPLPAGGKVVFAPGGYHVMLMGLKKPLAVGDQFPATLTFASGAKVSATLGVGIAPPSMD